MEATKNTGTIARSGPSHPACALLAMNTSTSSSMAPKPKDRSTGSRQSRRARVTTRRATASDRMTVTAVIDAPPPPSHPPCTMPTATATPAAADGMAGERCSRVASADNSS